MPKKKHNQSKTHTLASNESAEAQLDYGTAFYFGNGVARNYEEAAKWYRRSADQNYAPGQYNLGLCYYHGQGVPQDYTQAVKYFRLAADQGNAGAQLNLGGCYFAGQGVGQDDNEAIKWFRRAAEQGEERAQQILQMMVDRGIDIGPDPIPQGPLPRESMALVPVARRCGGCGKAETRDKKLLACGRCRKVRYCTAECQRKAWKEHKKVCKK